MAFYDRLFLPNRLMEHGEKDLVYYYKQSIDGIEEAKKEL
jgi:hypothetical protein